MGGVSAQAADLGGNCCADLEERVAELEATTARKGNRKMSLTVYGQVNESIMYWDDGHSKDAYIVTNQNSRSRFGFKGDAKINADLSAGFLIEIGLRRNASNNVTQSVNLTQSGLDIRHEAAFVSSKTFGTVWMGWTSSATDGITEIDLGATAASAFDKSAYLGRFDAHAFGGITWNQLAARGDQNWSDDDSRREIVRWISPTIAGFTLSADWGNASEFWDVALRYATEISGFRFAGGVGYWDVSGAQDANFGGGGQTVSVGGCNTAVVAGKTKMDCNSLGASASLMHVQTGLFVSGAYSRTKDNETQTAIGPGFKVDPTDTHWQVRGGIQKNWFGMGATTLYGDYAQYDKGAYLYTDIHQFQFSSNVKAWSIGVNQTIDAAAMDLYAFYQNYSGDATGATKFKADDLSMVVVGTMIKF
jgi:predicted porin